MIVALQKREEVQLWKAQQAESAVKINTKDAKILRFIVNGGQRH